MPTKKILVADDDPDLVALLKAFLEDRKWAVAVARDAMQVTMLARWESPQAVLLDITMPGGDGIRSLKQLKASSKLREIPVVVMSARNDEATARTATDAGAVKFLPKPLNLETVHQTLVELIGEPT